MFERQNGTLAHIQHHLKSYCEIQSLCGFSAISNVHRGDAEVAETAPRITRSTELSVISVFSVSLWSIRIWEVLKTGLVSYFGCFVFK